MLFLNFYLEQDLVERFTISSAFSFSLLVVPFNSGLKASCTAVITATGFVCNVSEDCKSYEDCLET